MDYDEYDDCLSEDDMLLMYMDEEQRRDILYVDTYDDILELIDESAGLELYSVAGVMAILDTGPISFDYLDEPPF